MQLIADGQQECVNFFPCPEEDCSTSYNTMKELNNHVLCDSHTKILDKYTLRDKACDKMCEYAEKLEPATRQVPSMEPIGTSCRGTDIVEKVWAIQKRKAAKRFTEKQSKDNLNGKFNER